MVCHVTRDEQLDAVQQEKIAAQKALDDTIAKNEEAIRKLVRLKNCLLFLCAWVCAARTLHHCLLLYCVRVCSSSHLSLSQKRACLHMRVIAIVGCRGNGVSPCPVRVQTLRNRALLSEVEGLSEELQRCRSEVERAKLQLKVDEASKAALEKEHASLLDQLARVA